MVQAKKKKEQCVCQIHGNDRCIKVHTLSTQLTLIVYHVIRVLNILQHIIGNTC